MRSFAPKTGILPSAQRALWPCLAFTREKFILYGGTALALRLGHRSSVDFDFFSFTPFNPEELRRQNPLLAEAEALQLEPNTLTMLIHEKTGPVKVSFFGGLTFGRVNEPDLTNDGVLRVASMADLFATKLNTVYQRAEAKDYLDIHAILSAGHGLAEGLQYAHQIYGENFNAMLPLQALCYFDEPGLQSLPGTVKKSLTEAVRSMR